MTDGSTIAIVEDDNDIRTQLTVYLEGVIGDASAAGAMPKWAFWATVQAKVCAGAVANLLAGRQPAEPMLVNVCYSLAAPDYGLSIAGVYQPEWDQLVNVPGSGGLSPDDAPMATRAKEAALGRASFGSTAKSLFWLTPADVASPFVGAVPSRSPPWPGRLRRSVAGSPSRS